MYLEPVGCPPGATGAAARLRRSRALLSHLAGGVSVEARRVSGRIYGRTAGPTAVKTAAALPPGHVAEPDR